jgi:hypothetical protein
MEINNHHEKIFIERTCGGGRHLDRRVRVRPVVEMI